MISGFIRMGKILLRKTPVTSPRDGIKLGDKVIVCIPQLGKVVGVYDLETCDGHTDEYVRGACEIDVNGNPIEKNGPTRIDYPIYSNYEVKPYS